MTYLPTSLVDILRWRAQIQPRQLAFRFLADGEFEEVVITYEDLDKRARSIAALLQSSASAGERALLLLPAGLDFIAAFFGCLYARVVAVPVYAPHPARLEKMLPAIVGIANNAGATIVLLNALLNDALNSQYLAGSEFKNMKLLVLDADKTDIRADKWTENEINGNDLAFLQYTSGSTRTSRGVMISHDNLLHNMRLIESCIDVTADTHAVVWLPPYHDMGLIGGILQAVYSGYPVTLIPHLIFLQRPFRWLQAISRFHATISVAPNFAYELCTRKVKPEQRQLLDLSNWKFALVGAEQVYYKTLEDFANYFAPCKFRREAFLPCYGLAEATLMVTGAPKGRLPIVLNVISSELEKNRAVISFSGEDEKRALVSCGLSNALHKVLIVDAETLSPCLPSEVGEIWVSGPSVSEGYWNNPPDTELTFGGQLSDNKSECFLRTGDLGFLYNQELFVTGRIKDMIILDGKNHYASDLERTVESAHLSIRHAGSAAFSINDSEGERVIIIAEVRQSLMVNEEDIIKAIRKTVTMHHELYVDDVRLVIPGGIPRTSSGKIRHYQCRKEYLAGTLKEILFT